jgi:hypothetical protein
MKPGSESRDEDSGRDGPLELLSATPLGDVLLFALVCAAGALIITAFRLHPVITVVLSLVVVVGFVWWAGRKANRPWRTSDYLTFGLITVVGLVAVGLLVLAFWVMLCDC